MQNERSPLEKSVDELHKVQQALEKAAEQTEDVKNGDCTPEDEKNEPSYILYNSIIESTIKILSDSKVVAGYKKIAESIGEETTKQFIELISICMSQSAHNAIIIYDDLLKRELTAQFGHHADAINKLIADQKATEALVKVSSAKLDELMKSHKISEVKKEFE